MARRFTRGNATDLHYRAMGLMGTAKHLAREHPEVEIPSVSSPLTMDDKRALVTAHVLAHGGEVFEDDVPEPCLRRHA